MAENEATVPHYFMHVHVHGFVHYSDALIQYDC